MAGAAATRKAEILTNGRDRVIAHQGVFCFCIHLGVVDAVVVICEASLLRRDRRDSAVHEFPFFCLSGVDVCMLD